MQIQKRMWISCSKFLPNVVKKLRDMSPVIRKEWKGRWLQCKCDKVMDHFKNPRNVGEIENADGIGEVGNPVCGDIMKSS